MGKPCCATVLCRTVPVLAPDPPPSLSSLDHHSHSPPTVIITLMAHPPSHHAGTYRPYDHLDEIAAAYSIAFTPDGSRIFAGFKDAVRVFDVCRPGRQVSYCRCTHVHAGVAQSVRSLQSTALESQACKMALTCCLVTLPSNIAVHPSQNRGAKGRRAKGDCIVHRVCRG